MVVYLCSMLFNSWNTSPLSPWYRQMTHFEIQKASPSIEALKMTQVLKYVGTSSPKFNDMNQCGWNIAVIETQFCAKVLSNHLKSSALKKKVLWEVWPRWLEPFVPSSCYQRVVEFIFHKINPQPLTSLQCVKMLGFFTTRGSYEQVSTWSFLDQKSSDVVCMLHLFYIQISPLQKLF